MKTMSIYEPAMCCSTGLCGVGVDHELLRISTVLNTLKQHGIKIGRYNLNNAPKEFVNNKVINDFINANGPDGLPAIVLDGSIVISGRYPTNEEFITFLDLPASLLDNQKAKQSGGCECKGGCC